MYLLLALGALVIAQIIHGAIQTMEERENRIKE